MNKLSNYLLLFFISAGFLFLASCGEDTETPDLTSTTIEFQNSVGAVITDTTVSPGTALTFSINVDFDETRGTLTLLVEDEDGNEIVSPRPLTTDPEIGLQTTYEIPEDTSGSVIIIASLEDADGTEVASEEFTINVEVPDVSILNAVILAAPLENEQSESFYSTSGEQLYSYNGVVSTGESISETIDFGYFYGNSLNATICSPDRWPDDASLYDGLARWTTRNNTDFRSTEITSDEFDEITSGSVIEQAFETNAANDLDGRASSLSEGDVIAFTTQDSRFGLIKVDRITGTSGSDGEIEITIKIAS